MISYLKRLKYTPWVGVGGPYGLNGGVAVFLPACRLACIWLQPLRGRKPIGSSGTQRYNPLGLPFTIFSGSLLQLPFKNIIALVHLTNILRWQPLHLVKILCLKVFVISFLKRSKFNDPLLKMVKFWWFPYWNGRVLMIYLRKHPKFDDFLAETVKIWWFSWFWRKNRQFSRGSWGFGFGFLRRLHSETNVPRD